MVIMTRSEFMTELKSALTDQMSEIDIAEVLADYGEFFETGLAEGETEEQISERLGQPARIALSLISRKPREDKPAYPAPALYRQISSLLIDILFAALPFVFISANLAVLSFFYPQLIPNMLRSFFSTVLISNHTWIATIRGFWLAAVCLSGAWWLFINPLSLFLFKGRTAGMKLAGLTVVSTDGGRASLIQCFLREWIGKLCINMLFSLIWEPLAFLPVVASLILAAFTKNGMTIWDVVSGTRVVSAGKNHARSAK